MLGDTIAAISTAMGEAGIGIIRLSGVDALATVNKIFVPKNKERFARGQTFTLYYGKIINPQSGEMIDEVLVSLMREPHSFTGEDVVEINCHGGYIAQGSILSLLLKSGARLAEPGEFTKRAFINGRLDLAQAEAVIDLIRAKTSLSAQSALEQLRGRLSAEIKDCRLALLEIIAQIEAGVDFPEEDLDLDSGDALIAKLATVQEKIQGMLLSANKGKILREGVNTAIIGQPNVGKSSLLNVLVGEERAIVTDIPGTTRDVLEEYISIKGIPMKLLDTAGIRETEDIVEKMGVERALKALEKADLVLFVIDSGRELCENEAELLRGIPQHKLVIVVNKIDLNPSFRINFHAPVYYVSATEKMGVEELEEGIVELVAGKQITETPVISNIRHITTLEMSAEKITDAIKSMEMLVPLDLVSIDIQSAWDLLGEVSGDTVGEDLLDQIFSRFCIGK